MMAAKSVHKMAPDGLIDYEGPVTRHGIWIVREGWERNGSGREGIAIKKSRADMWVAYAKCFQGTESAFMNIIEELKVNYEAANELWGRYKDRLTEFRSAVKNDVTSLEASARKTTEAVNKMTASYKGVLNLLNSAEMENAVQNAERLSAAMQALANLQSHKLVFAVTDQTKAE